MRSGLAALAAGDAAGAVQRLWRARETAPLRPDVEAALGRALLRTGRAAEAALVLGAAVEREPRDVDAWILLGMARRARGDAEAAAAAYREALAIDPCSVAALINLGNAARESGDAVLARSCYRRATGLAPDSAVAHYHLGVSLRDSGEDAEALQVLSRAVELDPRHAHARFNLANVLCDLGRSGEAAVHLRAAVALRPDDVTTLTRCGALFAANHHVEDGIEVLQRAVALAPAAAGTHANLGLALANAGRIEDALASYDRALALAPDDAVEVNRAFALLLAGRWQEGWAAYERRWQEGRLLAPIAQALVCPAWRGEPLGGKVLFVLGEQGIGDEIMFASILPEILAEAAHVVVQCSQKLERLFARSFPQATVLGFDRVGADWPQRLVQASARLPRADVYTTLGSLALHRRAEAAAFPRHEGYLRASPERVAAWRERLAALGEGVAVGFAWRGGTAGTGRNRRSIALEEAAPLLARSGVAWVSLQYDECAEELAALRRSHGLRIHHWPEAIDDYDETAALVCALDRVVSVCTAVVHLGGALGRRVEVMAPAVPEWRYGLAGGDMPWYPSVHIERQTTAGEWRDVFDRVGARLPGSARPVAPARGCAAVAFDRGNEAFATGRFGQACAAFREVLAHAPDDVAAAANLAAALAADDRSEEAVAVLHRALERAPAVAALHANLGTTLHDVGRFESALPALERAALLAPDAAGSYYNLGGGLQALGQWAAAHACYRRAIELDPAFADAHGNLGVLLYLMRRVPEALAALDRALELDPYHPEYRLNRAYALLLAGRWSDGWREHEWRLAKHGPRAAHGGHLAPWRGERIENGSVLLHSEQGYGDAIQFARYAPLVAARGLRVVLAAPAPLVRLFRSLRGVEEVVGPGDPVPACDRECALMSLPAILGTTLENVPCDVPYLHPSPGDASAWAARVGNMPGLRVGVVWAGSPRNTDPQSALVDARRSLPPDLLAPLADVPGVTLVSLQKGPVAQPRVWRPVDPMDAVSDFADTAALMANLDLVVTVDTAVAHLAGALGRPVWMLSRFDGCWRWLLEGERSVWYPTMRVLRQPVPGDWASVVRHVRELLVAQAGAR